MKKWLRVVILVFGILVVLFIASIFLFNGSKTPITAGKFITSNPFDLTQIKSLSKFRSCEGHNFSGFNAGGVEETYRTMKHYISAVNKLAETTGKIKILAPFNGKVSQIADDPRGSNVYLSAKDGSNGWNVLLFHIDLLTEFNDEGKNINSGELIGYANLSNNAANFDISMRYFGLGDQRNATPFLYMTEEVLAEYSSYGITPDNIIISKEERDSAPCKLAPGQIGRDAFYDQSEAGKSWVELRR